jgi:hypothetical protein
MKMYPMRAFTAAIILLAVHTLYGEDLTLNQKLIVACYKLDVDKVVKCLRDGADVNARLGKLVNADDYFSNRWNGGLAPIGCFSWTPLIALAGSRDYPDPPDNLGDIWKDYERANKLQNQIPLEQIEKRRNDAMMILIILLSHRCNLEDNDGYGATALYDAAYSKKVSFAKMLIDFGANPNVKVGIYIDGAGDKTPLHAACGSQELVDYLLDHGADPNAKDSEGRTPADWYSRSEAGKYEFVKTPDGWRVRLRAQTDEKKK